jgi:hypothetical protein
MYHFRYDFRSRLMKTLTREAADPTAIHIWSSYFGAELGRLRAQILYEPEAQEFQRQTYKVISMLPPMTYHQSDHDVTQTYCLTTLYTPPVAKLTVVPEMLRPCQQDAWMVARNIGIFGHPLVRKLLDRG